MELTSPLIAKNLLDSIKRRNKPDKDIGLSLLVVMREVGSLSELQKMTVPQYMAIINSINRETEEKNKEYKKLNTKVPNMRRR